MRAYLAASYSRRAEMVGYAADLRDLGYVVAVRWITGEHEGMENDQIALEDREDLRASDLCISFTGTPEGARARGGRHVEFGMANAWGQRLILVGQREGVFHWLPEVEQFDTWEQARAALAQPEPAGYLDVTP